MGVFRVILGRQDKGGGPKRANLLSAHHFFGTQPRKGGTWNSRNAPYCLGKQPGRGQFWPKNTYFEVF